MVACRLVIQTRVSADGVMFTPTLPATENSNIRYIIIAITIICHGVVIAALTNVRVRPFSFIAPQVLAVSVITTEVSVNTPTPASAPPERVPDSQPKSASPKPLPHAQAKPVPVAAETPAKETGDASPAAAPAPALKSEPSEMATAAPATSPTGNTAAEPSPLISPRFDAAYLSNPAPIYPSASLTMGEQGKVLLNVLVSPTGLAQEVRVRTSSGFDRLDQAAREAVRRWKFIAAQQGGEAVGAWVVVPIQFNLRR